MPILSINHKENSIAVTSKLLRQLKVKVNESTIQQTLKDHPDYPKMSAISICLEDWKVSNQTYRIPQDDYNVEDLLFPFIAQSDFEGGFYFLIHQITDNLVIYSDEKVDKAFMTEEKFLKQWSGVALHATSSVKSGEVNYKSNKRIEVFNQIKTPLLLIVILGFLFLIINWQTLELNIKLLILVKVIGVVVSTLLLMYSVNTNNPMIQNLCSLGKKNNCNAILKSNAALVFTWLSWSEVGFFYFTGSLLALLFLPLCLPYLLWLNLLALPYTVYSIKYQFKNNNWCVLCCTIQVLFALEFLNTIIISSNSLLINILEIRFTLVMSLSLSFLVPVFIWAFLKPFFLKAQQYKGLQRQLKKFKFNTELFNKVLTTQPKYSVPDSLMPIILGNPEAKNVITMVSNPFCKPCAVAHQALDSWLEFREDVKLKIIFTSAKHDSDVRNKISKHVMSLALLKDIKLVTKAINDWYQQENKKYENWATKYPVDIDDNLQKVIINQREWCELTEIKVTPTILINGYKLPAPYTIADIKYLVT
jgi:hypothetical protein